MMRGVAACAVAAVVAVGGIGASCRQGSEPAQPARGAAVAPSRAANGAPAADDRPLVRVGAIPRYNPRTLFLGYQPILDYLSSVTPYRFELRPGRTYPEAVDMICDGDVELSALGPLTCVEAMARCGVRPFVRVRDAQGRTEYHSVIVVRESSPIRTLEDLRGRSLAFASPHSTSGNLIARVELARAGLAPSDLSACVSLRHHDAVARAVLRGDFDAGAMKDVVAMEYASEGLRIIHRSVAIPSVPLVAGPAADSSMVRAVRDALLRIDPDDPDTRRMLATWDAEFRHGFAPATDSDYDPIRRALEASPRPWCERVDAGGN